MRMARSPVFKRIIFFCINSAQGVHVDFEQAQIVIHRIEEAVSAHQMPVNDGQTVSVGISIGAAELSRDGDTLQEQLDNLAVYRGELLPGFYDDWVTHERERLEALFEHKMQRLLDRLG